MNIHKEINLFKYAEQAQQLLARKGIDFTSKGFPDLTHFTYTTTLPEEIEVWPYNKRNQALNPSKTVLTFFEDDKLLYGYLNSIDKVTSNLILYYGVTGFDISPCITSNTAIQKAALLINTLVNGILLTNNIRVIPSLRTGGPETVAALKCYPQKICYAYGSLGCRQKLLALGQQMTAFKLALCKPSQVLVYGNLSATDATLFDNWNTPVLSFPDYQRESRKRSKQKGRYDV